MYYRLLLALLLLVAIYYSNKEPQVTQKIIVVKVPQESKQLKEYQATEQEIISLGATPKQAKDVIKSSEALNVSPKS